jgi:hypothetical protein
MKPTILFLFNSSHYAVQPWLDDGGFECVSVDYSDTDHSGTHRPTQNHKRHTRLNIDLCEHGAAEVDSQLFELGLEMPSFILSFAPCTDMAVCGNRSRADKLKADPQLLNKALALATVVTQWDCPSIVENPVSILATLWKKPTGYVQPWWFACDCPNGAHPEFPNILPPYDMYNKKTGLWCQNGAHMPEQCNHWEPKLKDFPGYAQLGGKSARTKYIRSLTPRGMAKAIYLANKDKALDTYGQMYATMSALDNEGV